MTIRNKIQIKIQIQIKRNKHKYKHKNVWVRWYSKCANEKVQADTCV